MQWQTKLKTLHALASTTMSQNPSNITNWARWWWDYSILADLSFYFETVSGGIITARIKVAPVFLQLSCAVNGGSVPGACLLAWFSLQLTRQMAPGCYGRVLMYLLLVLLFLNFGLGFWLGTSRRTERRLWMFSSREFWFSSLFHCPLLFFQPRVFTTHLHWAFRFDWYLSALRGSELQVCCSLDHRPRSWRGVCYRIRWAILNRLYFTSSFQTSNIWLLFLTFLIFSSRYHIMSMIFNFWNCICR